ncbi:MAG: hypothetical protein K2I33_02470, partial [Oscillospiraceae bacterium]|nr:hypothetical protein [Oscillospiraceae bacterium]
MKKPGKLICSFLVSQQETNQRNAFFTFFHVKESKTKKNFIRHFATELIILPVKGKTLHLNFTPIQMGAVKRRTQAAKISQHSFGRVPCLIVFYQLCSRYIFCFFFRVNKKEVCFFVTFF